MVRRSRRVNLRNMDSQDADLIRRDADRRGYDSLSEPRIDADLTRGTRIEFRRGTQIDAGLGCESQDTT